MKKILLLLLSAALVLSLCACGDSTPSTEASATKGNTATTNNSKPAETTPTTAEQTEAPVVESTEAPVESTEAPFVPQGKVEITREAVPTKWTLKELGPVVDGEGTLTFRSDDLLVRYEKDEDGNTLYLPVDHMGKQIAEGRYGYFEEFLPGLFLVSSLEDTVNNTGLMTEDGEMLIPCEAAIINKFTIENSDETSTRFIRVIYATEETTNEDEAFFYATNALFSLHPEEGDKLYKGYAKIYDLENKCFVPDLTITNPARYATKVSSAMIFVETVDDEKIIYSADGKELFKTSDYTTIDLGDGFYVLDYKQVFDTEGQLLFQAEGYDNLQIIKGSARFLFCTNYDTTILTVYDFYGNELFIVDGLSSVSAEAGGFFACSEDDKALLYNENGELVFSMDNCYIPSYEGHGIWQITPDNSDVNSSYYLTNGTTLTGSERYAHNFVNELDEDGFFSFFPWNKPTEKVSVEASYTSTLTDGLVCANGDTRSLVDCFSGETLMTADNFEFANSKYVYAKIDGVYHVYEIVLE